VRFSQRWLTAGLSANVTPLSDDGTMVKNKAKPRTARNTVTKCTTVAWHSPLCSDCGEPIENIRKAYAAWLIDKDGRTYDPQVVHQGGHCGHANRDLRRSLPPARRLQDLPVEWLRRSPLEAIHIALRSGAGLDDDLRLTWVRWLAVVLGLPASAWNSLAAMEANQEVADVVINRC
jgi:hypothetical protein